MILYNALINTLLILCMVVAVLMWIARLVHVGGEIIRLQAYRRHDPTYIVLPFYPLTTRPFVRQAASQYRASVQVISTLTRERLVETRLRDEEAARTTSLDDGGLSRLNSSSGSGSADGSDASQPGGLMGSGPTPKVLSSASPSSSSASPPGSDKEPNPKRLKEHKKPDNSDTWPAVDLAANTADTVALENSMARLVRGTAAIGSSTTAVAVHDVAEEQVGGNDARTQSRPPTPPPPSKATPVHDHKAHRAAEKHCKRQAKRIRAIERQNQHFTRWFTAVFGSGDITLDLLNETHQPIVVLGLYLPLNVASRHVTTESSMTPSLGSSSGRLVSSGGFAHPGATGDGPTSPHGSGDGSRKSHRNRDSTSSAGGLGTRTCTEKGEIWLSLQRGHVELSGTRTPLSVDSPTHRVRGAGGVDSPLTQDLGEGQPLMEQRSQPLALASPRSLLTTQSKRAMLELFVAMEAAQWAEAFSRKQFALGHAVQGSAAMNASPAPGLLPGASPSAAASGGGGFGGASPTSSTGTGAVAAAGGHGRRATLRTERAAVANSADTLRFTQQMVCLWTNVLLNESATRRTQRQPDDLFAIPKVPNLVLRTRVEKRLLRSAETAPEVHHLLARCRVLQALQPQYTALSVWSDLRALRFVVRHWSDGKGHGHAPVLPLAPPPPSATAPRQACTPFASLADSSHCYASGFDRYSRLSQERFGDSALAAAPHSLQARSYSFYNPRIRRHSADNGGSGRYHLGGPLTGGASGHTASTATHIGRRHGGVTRETSHADSANGSDDGDVGARASSAPAGEAATTPPSLSLGAMAAADEFLAAIARAKAYGVAHGRHASSMEDVASDCDSKDNKTRAADGTMSSSAAVAHGQSKASPLSDALLRTAGVTVTQRTPPHTVTTAESTRTQRADAHANLNSVLSRVPFAQAMSSDVHSGRAAPPLSPYDLRVAYIIAADRDSLLRAVTVEATRTFVHGTTSFLCFYQPSDESRARRRRRRQLEHQRHWEKDNERLAAARVAQSPPQQTPDVHSPRTQTRERHMDANESQAPATAISGGESLERRKTAVFATALTPLAATTTDASASPRSTPEGTPAPRTLHLRLPSFGDENRAGDADDERTTDTASLHTARADADMRTEPRHMARANQIERVKQSTAPLAQPVSGAGSTAFAVQDRQRCDMSEPLLSFASTASEMSVDARGSPLREADGHNTSAPSPPQPAPTLVSKDTPSPQNTVPVTTSVDTCTAAVVISPQATEESTTPADGSLLTASRPVQPVPTEAFADATDLSILTPIDAAITSGHSPIAPNQFPSYFVPEHTEAAPSGKAASAGRRGRSLVGGRGPPTPLPRLVAFACEDAHSLYSDDGGTDRYRAAVTVSLPGQTYLLAHSSAGRARSAAVGSTAPSTPGPKRRTARTARAALGQLRSPNVSSSGSSVSTLSFDSANGGHGSLDEEESETDGDQHHHQASRSSAAAVLGADTDGALVAEGPSGVEVSALALDALRHRVRDYVSDADSSSNASRDDEDSLTSTGTDLDDEGYATVPQDLVEYDEGAGAPARHPETHRRRVEWRRRVRQRERRRARRQRRREQRRRHRRRREKRRRRLRRQAERAPLGVDLPVAMALLFFVPSPAPILPEAPHTGLTSKSKGRLRGNRSQHQKGDRRPGRRSTPTDALRLDANGNIIRPYPTITCATSARMASIYGGSMTQPAAGTAVKAAAEIPIRDTGAGSTCRAAPSRAEMSAEPSAPPLVCITCLYGATGADVATALSRATKARDEEICRPFLDDEFSMSDGPGALTRESTLEWQRAHTPHRTQHGCPASTGTLPPSPYPLTPEPSTNNFHVRTSTSPMLPETAQSCVPQPVAVPPRSARSRRAVPVQGAHRPTAAPESDGRALATAGNRSLEERPLSPLSTSGHPCLRSVSSTMVPQSPVTATLHRDGEDADEAVDAGGGERPRRRSLDSSTAKAATPLSTPSSDAFEELQSWDDGGSATLSTATADPTSRQRAGNSETRAGPRPRTSPRDVPTAGIIDSAVTHAYADPLTAPHAHQGDVAGAGAGSGTAVPHPPLSALSSTRTNPVAAAFPDAEEADTLNDIAIPSLLVVPDVVTREVSGSASYFTERMMTGPSSSYTRNGGAVAGSSVADEWPPLPPAFDVPRDPTETSDVLAPLTRPDQYPGGLGVPVSLLYVRVGDDLYAVTEIVDRTFIQYRQRRVKLTGAAAAAAAGRDTSRGEGGLFSASHWEESDPHVGTERAEEPVFGEASPCPPNSVDRHLSDLPDASDGELVSNTSLLFSSAVRAQKSRSCSASLLQHPSGEGGLANASFASVASISSENSGSFRPGTPVDAAARAAGGVRQPNRRAGRSRREAASAKGFGDLTYSFRADVTAPGMRRELVHICWRCLTAEADVVLVPCGHFAVCSRCAAGLQNCCICQQKIAGTIRLYHRGEE